MNNMSEFSNKLQNLISERNEYENVINDLCHIFGVETDRDDWLNILLDCAKDIKNSNGGGVSAETNHIIDLTLNAVQLQLDNIYMYNDEPYIDVNDYSDEVNILLVGKDDTFSLDETEVRDCVYDDLTPKEKEVSADEQADAENVSEETIKENENE